MDEYQRDLDAARYSGAEYLLPKGPQRDAARLRAVHRVEKALDARRPQRDYSRRARAWLALIMVPLMIAVMVALVWAARADAHWQPGRHNTIHAIQLNFGSHWRDAVDVSHCEAGAFQWQVRGRPWTSANGQYKGLFQMGDWARDKFGHGPGPWAQAKAAAKNFRSNGSRWGGQWGCSPYTNPMPSWLLHRLGFR
jgi:hypothetical protein